MYNTCAHWVVTILVPGSTLGHKKLRFDVLGSPKEKLANLSSYNQTHSLSWQHIVIEESGWSINIKELSFLPGGGRLSVFADRHFFLAPLFECKQIEGGEDFGAPKSLKSTTPQVPINNDHSLTGTLVAK